MMHVLHFRIKGSPSKSMFQPGLWSQSSSDFGWQELEPKAFRW